MYLLHKYKIQKHVLNLLFEKKIKLGLYLYGFGLAMSLDRSSQTGAGSRNGGCGTGAGVDVGGTIGPWLVFQSTRIASEWLARQETINATNIAEPLNSYVHFKVNKKIHYRRRRCKHIFMACAFVYLVDLEIFAGSV